MMHCFEHFGIFASSSCLRFCLRDDDIDHDHDQYSLAKRACRSMRSSFTGFQVTGLPGGAAGSATPRGRSPLLLLLRLLLWLLLLVAATTQALVAPFVQAQRRQHIRPGGQGKCSGALRGCLGQRLLQFSVLHGRAEAHHAC